MHEIKAKVEKICEMKDDLVCAAQQELAQGVRSVDTHEMGQVVDMIKDLADAEKNIWKACYYKSIVEAMHEAKEEDEMRAKLGMENDDEDPMGYTRGRHRMGYDHYRYASGRFAPKGHGHYSAGFTPTIDMEGMEPWMMAPWSEAMGYMDKSGQNGSRSGGSNGGSRMGYPSSERGHRYDAYSQARRGYHESRDAKSKEHMDASAKEYVTDISEAMKEIWKDADPNMRKEIKNKFTALMNEMN